MTGEHATIKPLMRQTDLSFQIRAKGFTAYCDSQYVYMSKLIGMCIHFETKQICFGSDNECFHLWGNITI